MKHPAPICPYCQKAAEIYGVSTPGYPYQRDYGYVWMCRPCDARASCHPKSTRPLGTLSDKRLRDLRHRAHDAFDPIWKRGCRGEKMGRPKAYRWLADQMGMSKKDCHISLMTEAQCLLVETVAMWWTGVDA